MDLIGFASASSNNNFLYFELQVSNFIHPFCSTKRQYVREALIDPRTSTKQRNKTLVLFLLIIVILGGIYDDTGL